MKSDATAASAGRASTRGPRTGSSASAAAMRAAAPATAQRRSAIWLQMFVNVEY